MLLDDAGLEVAGRHHHADPLHVREEPQQGRLVGHAVLQRHHRRAVGQRGTRSSTAACVWWLLTASRTVVGRPQVGLARRLPTAGTSTVRVAVRGATVSPSGADRREVVAAGHQRHVEPRVVQPGAEDAADGSRRRTPASRMAASLPASECQPRLTDRGVNLG